MNNWAYTHTGYIWTMWAYEYLGMMSLLIHLKIKKKNLLNYLFSIIYFSCLRLVIKMFAINTALLDFQCQKYLHSLVCRLLYIWEKDKRTGTYLCSKKAISKCYPFSMCKSSNFRIINKTGAQQPKFSFFGITWAQYKCIHHWVNCISSSLDTLFITKNEILKKSSKSYYHDNFVHYAINLFTDFCA